MQSAAQIIQHAEQRVAARLSDRFAGRRNDAQLLDAIRYSGLAPGKRIRPCLVYAVAHMLDVPDEKVDDAAVAVELIHAYSLIHDDLPAMDDDDERRGQPSCHKQYGEALAILAGDAMQAMAFEVLACSDRLDAAQSVALVAILARRIGTEGMAGGQALDTAPNTAPPTQEHIELIHRLKTGALMEACVQMALACADDVKDADRRALESYAGKIGLCFQIKDDLLDGSQESDAAALPAVIGREACRQRLAELSEQSLQCLESLSDKAADKADRLRTLTRYIAERND